MQTTAYLLIDLDLDRRVVAAAPTVEAAVACAPYLSQDCVEGAQAWHEVVAAARSHDDGIMGLVEGYTVEALDRRSGDL